MGAGDAKSRREAAAVADSEAASAFLRSFRAARVALPCSLASYLKFRDCQHRAGRESVGGEHGADAVAGEGARA